MNIVNNDPDLLTTCVDGLQRHLRKAIETVQPTNGGDTFLRIQTDPPLTLLAQISRHRHPTGEQIRNDALRARERLGTSKDRLVILLAPWIPDHWGDFLREQGVAYADSLGNAWLAANSPALLVNVRGNKPASGPRPAG